MNNELAEILKELEGTKDEKGPVSVYLTLKEFDKFKRLCGDTAPSRVIDQLIKRFNRTEKDTAA